MKLPFLSNDTSDSTGNSPANSASESATDIQQPTAALVEKHTRKKRSDAGKPRGNREAPQVQGQMLDPANAVNLDLIKKSVAATVGAVDGLICRRIGGRCERLQMPMALGKELVDSVALTPNEQEIISESTALIFQRHEFLMRHAPEVMLASVMAAWGFRVVTVLKKLDSLEERMREAAKKARDLEPSPQSN